ncbi:MAG: oxidoreductase [Desulfobulbus propionicus]|nr:MAG: oxidoreductase [Desulfobulbus propionicus]
MHKFQEKAVLVFFDQLSRDVFRIGLKSPLICAHARPGQFVMVKATTSGNPLLRRPFSIHDVREDNLYLLFKVVGKGTELMSQFSREQEVDILGPLGNSFQYREDTAACLVGGGMGIAPFLFFARDLQRRYGAVKKHSILLGARDREELEPLTGEFQDLGYKVVLATDNGSLGHHGFVSELVDDQLTPLSRVYVCGPGPLMAAVAAVCRRREIPCQVSLEAHMACGMGACLGCTVHSNDGDYRHVCTHGPIFASSEVQWKL